MLLASIPTSTGLELTYYSYVQFKYAHHFHKIRQKVISACLPTAGDMDRDPLEPVGLGVGLRCGVVARPALPLPPESLLFCPCRSWSKTT